MPLTLSISNISKCTVIVQIPYPTKWAWPFSGILQRIDNFAQTPSYSLGSNYPKTVELVSAKCILANLEKADPWTGRQKSLDFS